MRVEPVDPRDAVGECTATAFRVYFWRREADQRDVDPWFIGWESTEFEITGADVLSVVDWAREQATRFDRHEIFARVDISDGPTLVRLAGESPVSARP
jgi:hypothetical protein